MNTRSIGWIAATAVAFAATLWITTGASGVVFGVLYAVAIAPGVALGRAVFGRHPAAWVAGGLIGYGTTQLARWTDADTRALCLVLFLVPALMGPPYRNLGARDASGTRYYRAYFTADFVWHTALAAELGKYSMPPRNPYLAPQPVHVDCWWTTLLMFEKLNTSSRILIA